MVNDKAKDFFKRMKEYDDAHHSPVSILRCKCGRDFTSYVYINYADGSRYSQYPCPDCGKHTDIVRIMRPGEQFTI